MPAMEISYLLRYLFAALFSVFAALMTFLALQELRHDMRQSVHPVPGCFIQRAATGQPHEPVQVIPLFHTTIIGKSARSDIRIRRPGIGKSHAIVYLFDGTWFIRPATRRRWVSINGVRIIPPTPLKDGDHLTIGDLDLIFIHQRQLTPDQTPRNTGSGTRQSGRLFGSWLTVNLFALLGGLVLVILTPPAYADVRLLLLTGCLGLVILVNVYDLLLAAILKTIDRTMMLCLLHLASLGLLIQTRLMLNGLFKNGADFTAEALAVALSNLSTQVFSLAAGLVLLPIIALISARTRLVEILSIISVVLTPPLLLLTLLFGRGSETHGATLWITIAGQSIQLTEFAKISYLAVLAVFFKTRTERRTQIAFAIWAAVIFFLVMLLPDLGFAMILLPTTLLVFVVMTSEYLTTLSVMVAGAGSGLIALTLFPHVRQRLAGWTSLWHEVNDSNRQIVYSLQAIARGGLFGRGIGNGNPEGIPLASSDMVFAIVCEELGLIAGLGLILVFIILWLRAARIAVIASDGFTSGLALGIGTALFLEAVIVIGGVTGLIPLTGATLPLIAEGGSSLLAKTIMLSILIGLSARRTGVK